MKAIDIAKEYFPDHPDDFLDFVIWEKTGFPSFWRIPKDGNTPEECFRKQLAVAWLISGSCSVYIYPTAMRRFLKCKK